MIAAPVSSTGIGWGHALPKFASPFDSVRPGPLAKSLPNENARYAAKPSGLSIWMLHVPADRQSGWTNIGIRRSTPSESLEMLVEPKSTFLNGCWQGPVDPSGSPHHRDLRGSSSTPL